MSNSSWLAKRFGLTPSSMDEEKSTEERRLANQLLFDTLKRPKEPSASCFGLWSQCHASYEFFAHFYHSLKVTYFICFPLEITVPNCSRRLKELTKGNAIQHPATKGTERINSVLTYHLFNYQIKKMLLTNFNILMNDETTKENLPSASPPPPNNIPPTLPEYLRYS